VAEELSFTRAAKKLYVAQPALSRQISELEHSLGVKLFDRTTRQVRLTPGGMAFVEEARAALIHTERAERVAKAVSRGDDSPVSVGFSPHYNFDLLEVIKKRAERHFGPEGIIFTSSFTREQIRSVLDGTWDAGLCFFPVDDPALETQVFLEEPVCIVVPSKHRLAQNPKRAVSHRELRNETVIRFARRVNPGFASELLQFWSTIGYKPKATEDVSTVAEATALVAGGAGIALFKSSLRDMLPPSVTMLDLVAYERLIVKLGVLYRKNGRSARCDKFLKLLSGLIKHRAKSVSASSR
jgi:DNA-binding transcriptional LysR family regulator